MRFNRKLSYLVLSTSLNTAYYNNQLTINKYNLLLESVTIKVNCTNILQPNFNVNLKVPIITSSTNGNEFEYHSNNYLLILKQATTQETIFKASLKTN